MTEQEAREALVAVLRVLVRQRKEAQTAQAIVQGVVGVCTDVALALAHTMADLGEMVQRGLQVLGKSNESASGKGISYALAQQNEALFREHLNERLGTDL